MKPFFYYNWMIREEWYRWCETVPEEELLKERTGGQRSILKTLFHIGDVEWSWIRVLKGEPDFEEDFEQFCSLRLVRELDAKFRPEVEHFVQNWDSRMEIKTVQVPQRDGSFFTYTWGEIIRHIIAHEIHHIGQLSVWSREIGKVPVNANFIRRGIIKSNG